MVEEQKTFRYLPLTLCIETVGGIATTLIPRGTPLPAKRSKTYTTAEDNQKSVEIIIIMGERPLAEQNMAVTKFVLSDIPPKSKGSSQITVTFAVDQNCNITATALETDTKKSVTIEHTDTRLILSQSTISKALEDAELNKVEDEKIKKILMAKAKAGSMINEAEKQIQQFQSSTNKNGTIETLEKMIASLGLALQENDYTSIVDNTEKLQKQLTYVRAEENKIYNDVFGAIFGQPQKQRSKVPTEAKIIKGKSNRNITKKDSQTLLENNARTLDRYTMNNFGKIFGEITWTTNDKLCFVLMPFANPYNQIYSDHIAPSVRSIGLNCLRADEILGTNAITKDIWEKIVQAKIIIADLTGQNPNVFYEVGLAHALGKDVIQITQTMHDVPFDLKGLRCIVYEYTPPGAKKLEERLKSTIHSIIASSSVRKDK